MELSATKTGETIRFDIKGEIDENGAQKMKEQFNQVYSPEFKTIIFNFDQVTHIGSAGIGKLLLFYKNVGINQGQIHIEKPSKTIYDLLLTLKLDSVFSIIKT